MCASGSFGITQALEVTEEAKYLAGIGPCLLAASAWVAVGFGCDLLRPHKPVWDVEIPSPLYFFYEMKAG